MFVLYKFEKRKLLTWALNKQLSESVTPPIVTNFFTTTTEGRFK